MAPQAPHDSRGIFQGGLAPAFTEVVTALGLDAAAILQRAGWAPPRPGDDAKVPIDMIVRAINLAAQASGRNDLGLLIGRANAPHATSLGIAFSAQPTVGGAIKLLAEHAAFRNDIEQNEVEQHDALLIWKKRLRPREMAANPYCVDCAIALSVIELRELLGPRWRPDLTCFRRKEPENLEPYRAFFGRVEFGHDFDGVVISPSDANFPIPSNDPNISNDLDRFLSSQASRGSASSLNDLEDLVMRLLLEGDCTVPALAMRQGVDPRTTHRRLKAHHVTFTQLVDRARRNLIDSQLRHSDRSLTEMAEILGFSSISTFSRWFKQEYGINASEFRRRTTAVTDAERYETLVEYSGDVILGVNMSGQITYANGAVGRLGRRRDEIVGAHLRDLLYPDDVEGAVGVLRSFMSAGTTAPGEHRWRLGTAHGAYEWFTASPCPLLDRSGRTLEVLFVHRRDGAE